VHGAAACVTVTLWPAMVSVAVREVVAVLAAKVTVTEPLPLPLAGDTVAQPWSDAAVHEQPAGAVTVTDDVPPLAVGVREVGATL
jgi:hypothetical protein